MNLAIGPSGTKRKNMAIGFFLLRDYEVAFIMWKGSEAVAAGCAPDIRGAISHCLNSAAAAIGFRMDEVDQIAGEAEERRVQAEIVRSILWYPPRFFGMKV